MTKSTNIQTIMSACIYITEEQGGKDGWRNRKSSFVLNPPPMTPTLSYGIDKRLQADSKIYEYSLLRWIQTLYIEQCVGELFFYIPRKVHYSGVGELCTFLIPISEYFWWAEMLHVYTRNITNQPLHKTRSENIANFYEFILYL